MSANLRIIGTVILCTSAPSLAVLSDFEENRLACPLAIALLPAAVHSGISRGTAVHHEHLGAVGAKAEASSRDAVICALAPEDAAPSQTGGGTHVAICNQSNRPDS